MMVRWIRYPFKKIEMVEEEKVIFLMGLEDSWKIEALEILKELGFDGEIYVQKWGVGYPLNWSKEIMAVADWIVIWVPEKLLNEANLKITEELVRSIIKAKRTEKFVLGLQKTSKKTKNLERIYAEETGGEVPYSDLKTLLKESVDYLNDPQVKR